MAPSSAEAIYFFCCQCQNGPMRWGLELVCWQCNHRQCANCTSDQALLRPKYENWTSEPPPARYHVARSDVTEGNSSDDREDAEDLLDQPPPWSWVEREFEKHAPRLSEHEIGSSSKVLQHSSDAVGSTKSSPDRMAWLQGDWNQRPSISTTPEFKTPLEGGHLAQGVDTTGSGFWFWRRKEPPPAVGFARVRFRCACGRVIWDDFPESDKNKVISILNQYVRDVSQQSLVPGMIASNGEHRGILKSLASGCGKLFGVDRTRDRGRPVAAPDSEAQLRTGMQHEQAPEPFYLTCVRQDSRIPSLEQIAAASINSDQDYFDMLRAISKSKRWSLRWVLGLRKVTSIRYVKLALYFDNKYVQIDNIGDLPKDKEQYNPCKDDFDGSPGLCFWAPNALLHYYEKRHAFWEHPTILPSIPRKLKGKLFVSADCASKEGWGMQLLDGIDSLRVGLIGVTGLLLSSFLGILWAKLHGNDVQGGTGLTQCLTGFVTFLVTMHGVVGFVEQRS